MSKKNFKTGLDFILGEPSTSKIVSKINTEEIETTRATFIVPVCDLEKIKSIAFWKRARIKDLLSEAIADYISKYEAINGPVQTPNKKQ